MWGLVGSTMRERGCGLGLLTVWVTPWIGCCCQGMVLKLYSGELLQQGLAYYLGHQAAAGWRELLWESAPAWTHQPSTGCLSPFLHRRGALCNGRLQEPAC